MPCQSPLEARFKSSLGHNDVWFADYVKSSPTRTFVLAGCGHSWTEVASTGHSFPTYSPRKSPRGDFRGEYVGNEWPVEATSVHECPHPARTKVLVGLDFT